MVEIQIGDALLALLAMLEFHLTQTSSVYHLEKFYLWMGVNPFHSTGRKKSSDGAVTVNMIFAAADRFVVVSFFYMNQC